MSERKNIGFYNFHKMSFLAEYPLLFADLICTEIL